MLNTITKIKTHLLLLIIFLFGGGAFGQINLVPNPSFEDTVSCPTTANQIDKAVGWHTGRGTPDYFNECDFITGNTSVPSNFMGFQYPFHGNAYAGFIAYGKASPNIREYITCQLIAPLNIGKKYNIRFYVSLSGGLVQRMGSNKTGLLFSTVNYDYNNPAPIGNYSQFYTDSIITDTLNWTLVEGSFIADSAYRYMSVGNYFDDMNTDTIMLAQSSYAYYYIDSISVTEDVTSSINEIKSHSFIVYPNSFSNKIRVQTENIRIETLQVFNMNGQPIYFRKESVNDSTIDLYFNTLEQGIYILIINDLSYFKIIKM
ncbi:MAG: T9SS type A sorting domain-containing protein [Bacteroidetes bacterium]|jgi:hypothetical protein|nr:T9SS type A sorting domain-containing protein [Bacteroidota bacterium]